MRHSGAIMNEYYWTWTWLILRHVFGQNTLHFNAGIQLTLRDLKALKQSQAVTRFLKLIVSSQAWKASDSSKSLALGPWKSWWKYLESLSFSFHTRNIEKQRQPLCVWRTRSFRIFAKIWQGGEQAHHRHTAKGSRPNLLDSVVNWASRTQLKWWRLDKTKHEGKLLDTEPSRHQTFPWCTAWTSSSLVMVTPRCSFAGLVMCFKL